MAAAGSAQYTCARPFLTALAKQVETDMLRDPVSARLRLDRLLDLLLDVRSPSNFLLSVAQANEVYPCPLANNAGNNSNKFVNIDCITNIICRGSSEDDFKKELSDFDDSRVCGRVWTHNFLAYRCKTCALSPCMSLCNQCFQLADHTGHDYNMFRSQAGGACDCGDENVMLRSGFCSRHGFRKSERGIPDQLLVSAKAVIPRLILRLVAALRSSKSSELIANHEIDEESKDYNQLAGAMEQLILLGQAMRKVITEIMLSQSIYQNMMQVLASTEYKPEDGIDRFSLDYLKNIQMDGNYDHVMANGPPLKLYPSTNFLEEIFFWAVELCLPESFTTFFLNLLPDQSYKVEFTRVFLRHYPALTKSLLEHPSRIDSISNHTVHMSVQLFSNESLALEMVLSQDDLLHVLLSCMSYMVELLATPSDIFEAGGFHRSVDVSQDVVTKHCYWPIFSDFLNLMAHQSVVKYFFSRTALVEKYSSIVECFSAMNPHKRAIDEHVQFENSLYITAFSVEIETCSAPLWSFVSHIESQKHEQVVGVLKILYKDLLDMVSSCGIDIDNTLNLFPDHLSFHWPLHRTFILLLIKFLNKMGENEMRSVINQLDIKPVEMKQLMFAPLHLLCRVNEITNNLWLRNGTTVMQQALTYMQPHFSHSLVDADILFVQFAACYLDADYFLDRLITMQSVKSWFTVNTNYINLRIRPDIEVNVVEAVLRLIALLVNNRSSLGIDDEEFCREELMASLCISDKPYSQLMDIVTEKIKPNSVKPSSGEDFKETAETLMEMLAVFSPPGLQPGGLMRQGLYQVTLESWLLHFNPLHTWLRSIKRADFQQAMQRYLKTMSSAGYCQPTDDVWPPFQPLKPISPHYKSLLNILQSRTLHGMIFCILYRAVYQSGGVPESLMAMTCHLFSLCLDHLPNVRTACEMPRSCFNSVKEFSFESWFPSNHILINSATIINEVHFGSFDKMCEASNCANVQTGGGANNEEWHRHEAKRSMRLIGASDNSVTDVTSMCFTHAYVNEDILSLLVRFHDKLVMAKDESKRFKLADIEEAATYHHNYNCGTGAHHVKLLLSRIIQLSSECKDRLKSIVEYLNPSCSSSNVSSGSHNADSQSNATSSTSDYLERKRRAKLKNKELMKAMERKQKKFLNDNYDSVVAAEKEEQEPSGAENSQRCIICNHFKSEEQQNESCTDYFVVVGFAQRSNVLSKRVLSKEEITHVKINHETIKELIDTRSSITAAKVFESRIDRFLEVVPDSTEVAPIGFLDSCMSNAGTLAISTCDHIAHNSCLIKYKTTILNNEPSSNVWLQPFSCPMCRKKSNIVVPIISGLLKLCKHVEMTLPGKEVEQSPRSKPSQSVTSVLSRNEHIETKLDSALGELLIEMTNSGRIIDGTCVFTGDPIFILSSILYQDAMFSLASHNYQVPVSTYSEDVEPNAVPSFLNLALNIQRFYQRYMKFENSDSSNGKYDVFLDPFMEFLSQLLKQKFDSNLERTIDVLVLDTLKREVVRKLLKWATQLQPDECNAWRESCDRKVTSRCSSSQSYRTTASSSSRGRERSSESFSSVSSEDYNSSSSKLLSAVLEDYCQIFKASAQDSSRSSELAFCDSSISGVIWSEKSLEAYLQTEVKQFLQLSTIFKSKLLQMSTPNSFQSNDISYLMSYFNMKQSNILDLPFEDATNFARLLTQPLVQMSKRKTFSVIACRALLTEKGHGMFLPPSLMPLPDDYDCLYAEYRDRTCSNCNNTPVNLAICLVCAQLVCLQERCCRRVLDQRRGQDSRYSFEACAHTSRCGLGVSVFLMLTTSQVLIVYNEKAAIWGCLHLDSHGEEDKELRRGKPLFLSKQRYEMLCKQWAKLNFDSVYIGWFNHNGKL